MVAQDGITLATAAHNSKHMKYLYVECFVIFLYWLTIGDSDTAELKTGNMETVVLRMAPGNTFWAQGPSTS